MVPSNTFTERETQEKEETTQRQSVKTCDMKIVVHTHTNKKYKTRTTRMIVTPKKKKRKKRIICRIKARTHQLRRRDPRDAAQTHPIPTPHQHRCDVATR